MVVAVVAVGMMQPAIHDVVNVVTMGHRFVSATRTVDMTRLVAVRGIGASFRIRIAHFDHVLFHHTILALVMEMAVVDVVDMIAVLDGSVPAVGAVLVVVVLVAGSFLTHNGPVCRAPITPGKSQV